jgi:hypothetical protein
VSYQDGGGYDERLILAKRRENEVALFLQPQRAAFPVLVGAAVVGVGVSSTGPRGMSGAVSGSDPAAQQSRARAPTRRLAKLSRGGS